MKEKLEKMGIRLQRDFCLILNFLWLWHMITFSIHLCNPDTQTCEKNNVNQNQPTELFTTYFHKEPILSSYLVFTNFFRPHILKLKFLWATKSKALQIIPSFRKKLWKLSETIWLMFNRSRGKQRTDQRVLVFTQSFSP